MGSMAAVAVELVDGCLRKCGVSGRTTKVGDIMGTRLAMTNGSEGLLDWAAQVERRLGRLVDCLELMVDCASGVHFGSFKIDCQ